MRIIIIGCGRLGSSLLQSLILKGHAVTIIDKDPQAFERLGPEKNCETVVGIGFDLDVLKKAGIERADGLAAVTSSDEANVVAARIAKQIFRVPKVVVCLYDPGQGDIFNRLGLQTVSPVDWGANRIADLLLMSRLDINYHIGAGNVDLVTLEAPQLLIGRTVNSLTMPGEFQVVAVTRGPSTFLPTRGTVVQENDLIHMIVLSSSASRLSQLLDNQAGG